MLATLANGQHLTSPLTGTVTAVNLVSGDLVPNTRTTTTPFSSVPVAFSTGFGSRFAGFGPASSSESVDSSTVSAPLSMTVVNTSKVRINIDASELVTGLLQTGEPITREVPGEPGVPYQSWTNKRHLLGRLFLGSGSSSSFSAVTYPITVSVDHQSAHPLPRLGMLADLSVAVQSAHGTVVPTAAIPSHNGRDSVTLANGRIYPVWVGLIGIDKVLVTRGLSAGARIRAPLSAENPISQPVRVEVLPSFGFSRPPFPGAGSGF